MHWSQPPAGARISGRGQVSLVLDFSGLGNKQLATAVLGQTKNRILKKEVRARENRKDKIGNLANQPLGGEIVCVPSFIASNTCAGGKTRQWDSQNF